MTGQDYAVQKAKPSQIFSFIHDDVFRIELYTVGVTRKLENIVLTLENISSN